MPTAAAARRCARAATKLAGKDRSKKGTSSKPTDAPARVRTPRSSVLLSTYTSRARSAAGKKIADALDNKDRPKNASAARGKRLPPTETYAIADKSRKNAASTSRLSVTQATD